MAVALMVGCALLIRGRPLRWKDELNDRAATVYNYDLACYVIRSVGGQEHSHAFQLSGSADAGNRVARFDRGLGVLDRRVGKARMKEPRRNRVNANTLPAPRGGEFPRQAKQP